MLFRSKPSASKSAKSFYESFFVGEDGTQYFIKPVSFDATDKNSELQVDFTFRYKNEIKDSATINISLISNSIVKEVNNISIKNLHHNVDLRDISLLYNEKKKDKFISRFTSKCSTQELFDIFADADIKIDIDRKDAVSFYITPNKTQKAIRSLNDNLLILFR